jgi:glycosyltransferase involved in cell wall biosynthesis
LTVQPLRHADGRALSIMLDGFNLSLEKGTGVATYGRNLSHALQKLDCKVGVIYGAPISSKDDSLLREVKFFDALPERGNRITKALRQLSGSFALGRFDVFRVPLTGAVLAREFSSRLPRCDDIWNVYKLFVRASARYELLRSTRQIAMSPRPDLMHWTYPLPIRLKGTPNIYTLHDLVPLRLPYTTLDRKSTYLALMRWIAKTADHIVTVSEASRRDIIELLGVAPDRVTNTYQAVSIPAELLERSDEDVAEEIEGVFGLGPRDYFLFFGSIEPKKNVRRIVEAYLSSGSRRPLVIVGAQPWKTEKAFRLSDPLPGVERNVLQIDYLSYPMLVSMIRMARGVLFPSLYEGFGLPILEAMLLNTPVITSNVSSIPEIAGDAALLVDPYDVRSITRAIRALDAEDDLCASLATRGAVQARLFDEAAYQTRLRDLYGRVLSSGESKGR